MYQPNAKILEKYADVLVNYALSSGKGVKQGEVVQCMVPDVAKPMLEPLQKAILKSGAHPIMRMLPTGLDKPFYEFANEEQLTFFPKKYLKARVDLIDHSIRILAEHDLHELKDTNPKKIVKAAESRKKVREWRNNKEYAGDFTWTIAIFGTEAMAKESGLTLKDYWKEIIKACFLDFNDPIGKWKNINKEQERVRKQLNSLQIDRLHVKGKKINLWIKLGKQRKWNGGSGRNIPSFEIFVSPDWRGTNGYIEFNQPLYRYGNLIEGVKLRFEKGIVVEAKAVRGEKLLKTIIKRPNADKIGEFSLTDSQATRITKFMANTLYDENVGGKYGNTHIALGMSYKDTYDGDPRKLNKSDWKSLGFNDSGEHCDIVSTQDRIVTAYIKDGSKKVIYRQGKFVI